MELVKQLLGENEVEVVLARLDRLTLDEARTTAAQSLEVFYGLIQNMKLVMDSEQSHWLVKFCLLSGFPYRWKGIDQWYPGYAGYIFLPLS